VRPALRAGLLPLWRDRETIQIGVDPRRAVALTGVGAAARLIGLLDGSRDRDQLVGAAAQLGIPTPLAERLLTLLAGAGLLIDYPAAVLRGLPADRRARLLPELAAASLARQDADGGAAVLARRCAAIVRIDGTGRIAAGIAEILVAAGVGVETSGAVETGGGAETGGGNRTRRPALLVLAGQLPDPAARLPDVPHLAVSAREAIGMVGPLVRPGVSACLRCLDLTRADRDPGWPLILAQVSRRQAEPVACGAVLAAAVAAQAAAQALAFVDCPAVAGPAENATLELMQPGWQWRRRGWPPHPACTCRASDGYLDGYGQDGDSR
jgi:hypothetical protein